MGGRCVEWYGDRRPQRPRPRARLRACRARSGRPMTARPPHASLPDAAGHFGEFGGKYVPETLMPALSELEVAYEAAKASPEFQAELEYLLRTYVGRPTPLTYAARLSARLAEAQGGIGPKVYLKREDLAHTGAHKINAALAQALLARRMG